MTNIEFEHSPVLALHALDQALVDRFSRVVAALLLDVPLSDEDSRWVAYIVRQVAP